MREVYQAVRVFSAQEFEELQREYKERYGEELKVIKRQDFPRWVSFCENCCDTFGRLIGLMVLGLLAFYSLVFGGVVETLPGPEQLLMDYIVDQYKGGGTQNVEIYNNIDANCFIGTVSPCQLQLIDPRSTMIQFNG